MSLSERQIGLIHGETEVHEGRKYFGEFDRQVGQETKTEIFELCALTSPRLSIIMPVMERRARFRRTFDRLTSSLTEAELVTTLIIMDNSLLDNTIQDVKESLDQLRGTPVIRVIYHHDPRMIQSTCRNRAYREFIGNSELIGVWDSDIYCSKETLREVMGLWDTASHMCGIAPPMGSYTKGNLEVEFGLYRNVRENPLLRIKLHMPGGIGEENGIWNGNILRTTMMRGAFFVKKSLVDMIARHNNDGDPWLKDFVVWQNVPFFLSARELGGDFGYAMSGKAMVLHDDRKDRFSVTQSASYAQLETLKSLSMLMVRNQVYSPRGKAINTRFLRYNIPAISRVTTFNEHLAQSTQEALLLISGLFAESSCPESFVGEWKERAPIFPEEVSFVISEVVDKLSEKNTFNRVKKLTSFNPKKPIYTI